MVIGKFLFSLTECIQMEEDISVLSCRRYLNLILKYRFDALSPRYGALLLSESSLRAVSLLSLC
jgi:hypothetical protein